MAASRVTETYKQCRLSVSLARQPADATVGPTGFRPRRRRRRKRMGGVDLPTLPGGYEIAAHVISSKCRVRTGSGWSEGDAKLSRLTESLLRRKIRCHAYAASPRPARRWNDVTSPRVYSLVICRHRRRKTRNKEGGTTASFYSFVHVKGGSGYPGVVAMLHPSHLMLLNIRWKIHQCGQFSWRRLQGDGCYGYSLSQEGVREG